jgi:N-acetylglutamate synthase-like GNAT family acetyltransferase
MTITIRAATERDQPAIRALARKERVKPIGLNWPNFVVAADGDAIVGAVQMREHIDGSRELGTLVVREDTRGKAIAGRLIDALLVREQGPVYMITGQAFASHYARWGFRPTDPLAAPNAIRRNYRMGAIGGGMISILMGRPRRQLAIFERPARASSQQAA